MKPPQVIAAGLVAALLPGSPLATPAAARSSSISSAPKEEFVQALRGFAEALAGSFGDEGSRVRSGIESMSQALDRWDASIRENEKVAATRGRNADVHQALGIVYLDRGRVADALGEFAAVTRLDDGRPDVYTLQGLAFGLTNQPLSALRALQRAAVLDTGDPRTAYRVAQQLRKIGRTKEARDALLKFAASERQRLARREADGGVLFTRADLLRPAVGVAPIFPPASYARGFAALRQGKYDVALARFRTAAAGDPLSARALVEGDPVVRAAAALRRGQIRSAVDELKAALDSSPRQSEIRRLLGIAYRADEQYENSAGQFRAAIDLNPLDERSHVALADVYVQMGRGADAEETLKNLLRVLPASGQAHYGLGRLYRTRQQHGEALHEFEAAAAADPLVGVDYLLQAAIGIYFIQTDYEAAIATYLKRIELNPNNVAAHRELGRTYLEQGRYDDASAELLAALLIKPDDAEAFTMLAQSDLGMNDYADAAESASRALALDPTQKGARYVLGMSLTRLGRVDEGRRELQEFQRLQAAATEAANREWELKMLKQQAAASIDKQDYDAAARFLEDAIPYEPDAAGIHTTLALVLARAGRYESSISHFKKALDLNGAPDILRDLADVYDAMGRHADAQTQREAYERVKQERLSRAGGNR